MNGVGLGAVDAEGEVVGAEEAVRVLAGENDGVAGSEVVAIACQGKTRHRNALVRNVQRLNYIP